MSPIKSMIIITLVFSSAFKNITATTIKQIYPNEMSCILETTLKEIYRESFSTVYKDHLTEEFKATISGDFDYCVTNFKNITDMLLVTAHIEQETVGWILFDLKNETHQAIIKLICVHPSHWQKGIGQKLVYSVLEYCPTIRSMAVVTRKINNISPKFYQSLGFNKTDFTLPEYAADDVQGYELLVYKSNR